MLVAEAGSRDDVISALESMASHGTAPRGMSHVFDVGTGPYLEYFEREVLDDLLAQGGATCKVISGNYGSGKTHLLDLLHERASRRGLAVVRTDLSQALSLEDWRILTRHILENVEAVVDGARVQSLPGILDALQDAGSLGSLARSHLPHPGFARAMSLMVNGGQLAARAREPLSRYLRGETVTAKEFTSYGIKAVKNSLSSRNAEAVLRTMVGGLHTLGIPGVVLLFDENEKTFVHNRSGAPPAKVREGANLLRRLIDATATGQVPGMAAVLTVLPTFVDACAAAYGALGQRLRVHAGGVGGSWRWPYLSIQAITPELSGDVFVRRLSDRIYEIVVQLGGRSNGLKDRLLNVGHEVLQLHAGQDHRRYVSRALSIEALKHLG